MAVHHGEIQLSSRGESEMHDVTDDVAQVLRESGVRDGIATVFVPGSTAGITTIEFEPGLVRDFPAAMERFAPRDIRYHHDETWHDGNGHSHVRASTIGPSVTVPVANGELMLGTWQQIILVDFDNRARKRRVIVTVMGEPFLRDSEPLMGE
ncbi:MAG: secondary thiamine-phosphate synthase enzyme YjbQ [Candidatus Eisenbacteria bacterium]|uniref:Secondary thiamine-phosphate synthase enzyme YjbQ n=1 Tax=Eiseniibacteriota bacterium TaxID=2212470 RepID=A0A956RQF2_UNCEI|nr:secondary thiamine-phosphate synthase enzyme YjbQ [Candidatus Eisenbacteria bacterium]